MKKIHFNLCRHWGPCLVKVWSSQDFKGQHKRRINLKPCLYQNIKAFSSNHEFYSIANEFNSSRKTNNCIHFFVLRNKIDLFICQKEYKLNKYCSCLKSMDK